MSEPMVVWVARDGDGSLWHYAQEPKRVKNDFYVFDGTVGPLPDHWLPDLDPGECRRMRLVDAPETHKEQADA